VSTNDGDAPPPPVPVPFRLAPWSGPGPVGRRRFRGGAPLSFQPPFPAPPLDPPARPSLRSRSPRPTGLRGGSLRVFRPCPPG